MTVQTREFFECGYVEKLVGRWSFFPSVTIQSCVESVDSECKEILKICRSFSVIVFYEFRLNVKTQN